MSTFRLCTLFDKNYMHKGIAMYQSLCETLMSDFVLYVLCIDDEVFDRLQKLNLPGIWLFQLSAIEKNDIELQVTKLLPPSNYGSQRDNYIWALAPYFINYVLTRYIEEGQQLMYVDSDIYFYESPEIIFEQAGGCPLALHTHRFSGDFNTNNDTGWFNVGVVVLSNYPKGREISRFWKKLVMSTNHEWYEKYGTCGDQKYLELIYLLNATETSIFDNEIPGFVHGAPWCCNDLEGKNISFFHFSHFCHDLKNDTWKDSYKGEWNPTQHSNIKTLYEEYFKAIKLAESIIKVEPGRWVEMEEGVLGEGKSRAYLLYNETAQNDD